MIASPPSSKGGSKEIEIVRIAEAAKARLRGGPANLLGFTKTSLEAGPVPMLFMALTLMAYSTPLVNPPISIILEVSAGFLATQVPPLREYS